jgi:hypothetical protein
MRKIYAVLFIFILCDLTANAQTTVTITADKDNTIYSESTTTSNGAGDNLFAGSTATGNKRRGLIHFNLSSIPTNAVVTAVTVKLTCNKQASASAGINLHKLSQNWGEGTSNATAQEGAGATATTNDATWANTFFPSSTWTTSGGTFTAIPSATASSVTFGNVNLSTATLVSDVQGFVTTPANNFGWIIVGSAEATLATALRFSAKETVTASDRPQITVTYNIVTPVTLKAFFATLQAENALIQWQTVTESKSDFFDIQHSVNGQEFQSIGKVNAAGNSNEGRNYSFTHSNISKGRNYYRLVQHDQDGSIYYSSIVLVSTKSSVKLQLAPNPVERTLKVTTSTSLDGASYMVVSASGQAVRSGTFNTQHIDVSSLNRGVYQLTIQTKDGVILRSQFIKN